MKCQYFDTPCNNKDYQKCDIYAKINHLCPVCGANIDVWKEVFANDLDKGVHYCGVKK